MVCERIRCVRFNIFWNGCQPLQELENQPRFTVGQIQNLKHFLPRHALIHHGDHEQYSVAVSCPRLYFQAAWRTWEDPQMFRRLCINRSQALCLTKNSFSHILQSPYSWAVRTQVKKLSFTFIDPKRKASFQKGRTRISYFQCSFKPRVGQESLPTLWSSPYRYFDELPLDMSFRSINDDLAGFFHSAPQDRQKTYVCVGEHLVSKGIFLQLRNHHLRFSDTACRGTRHP